MHQHFNLKPTVTKEHLPHFMVPFSNFFRIRLDCWSQTFLKIHTANSRKTVRKVVGKSARANPERYWGGFEFTVLQRNLKEWQERTLTYVREC